MNNRFSRILQDFVKALYKMIESRFTWQPTPIAKTGYILVLKFPPASVARLEKVRLRTNAPSLETVISDAFRTWETITEEVEGGGAHSGKCIPMEVRSL